jgi:hypothetical protein
MGWYIALVPMALALAACRGGGGGAALPTDPVARAAEKTSQQGSAKSEVIFSGPDGGLAGKVSGVFNNDAEGSGRASLEFPVLGHTLRMDMVFRGRTVYVKSSVFHADPTFPKGKDWVAINLDKAAKVHGFDLNSLGPQFTVALLRGSKGDNHKVFTEKVRGTETTHYSFTVDRAAAARKAKGKAAKTLRKMAKLTGVSTYPFDVWIDKQGLVREDYYSQPLGPETPGMTITEFDYDYGPKVPIEAPPSDKVFHATKRVIQQATNYAIQHAKP